MTPTDHILSKIHFLEKELRDLKDEMLRLEQASSPTTTIIQDDQFIDVNKLVSDEGYRIEYALKKFKHRRKDAAVFLKMSERTLYRLIMKYDVDKKKGVTLL